MFWVACNRALDGVQGRLIESFLYRPDRLKLLGISARIV
jgi:hypothetical protein